MPVMKIVEQLLCVAEAYAKAEEIPRKTVSWRALGDSKKLDAIAAGADIQASRFEQAMSWFSDNWPGRTAWPKGVKRPAPSEANA